MHTGTWKSRTRMAWASWTLAAGLCLGGLMGLFLDKDTGIAIGSGVTLIGTVKGIMVAGKVTQDTKGTK